MIPMSTMTKRRSTTKVPIAQLRVGLKFSQLQKFIEHMFISPCLGLCPFMKGKCLSKTPNQRDTFAQSLGLVATFEVSLLGFLGHEQPRAPKLSTRLSQECPSAAM